MPMGVLPACFSATHERSDDNYRLRATLGVGPGSSGRTPRAPAATRGNVDTQFYPTIPPSYLVIAMQG